MNKLLIICFSLSIGQLLAKDFGVRGPLFPIEEENIVDLMQRTLGGNVDKYLESVGEQFLRPTPIAGINKVKESRTFTTDVEGTLPSALLFFDGDDEEQLSWAREQGASALWILVKGSPIELEQQEQHEVFFDQHGLYTTRLGIKNIPAKATSQENHIVIEEISLN